MAPARIKTYWHLGPLACCLFTGDGTFELRLLTDERVLQIELCTDGADAYEKSKAWHLTALRAAHPR